MNRPAKSFLKAKFEEWYALKLAEQLQGSSIEELEPINLGLPILKELGAKWLAEMATYIIISKSTVHCNTVYCTTSP